MKKMILGIFPKREDADEALFHLTSEGFQAKETSVIAREDRMSKYRQRKQTGGDGVVAGGVLGGLAGLMIAATPVILPGIGLLIAGPLTVLTGLAMGALTGGILGALVDLGVSETQARRYEKRIQEGGVLLAVTVQDEEQEKAQKLMRDHDAQELTVIPYTGSLRKLEERSTSSSAYQHAGMKGGKTEKSKKV